MIVNDTYRVMLQIMLSLTIIIYDHNMFTVQAAIKSWMKWPGNTNGGSITVPMTSCLTDLESAV